MATIYTPRAKSSMNDENSTNFVPKSRTGTGTSSFGKSTGPGNVRGQGRKTLSNITNQGLQNSIPTQQQKSTKTSIFNSSTPTRAVLRNISNGSKENSIAADCILSTLVKVPEHALSKPDGKQDFGTEILRKETLIVPKSFVQTKAEKYADSGIEYVHHSGKSMEAKARSAMDLEINHRVTTALAFRTDWPSVIQGDGPTLIDKLQCEETPSSPPRWSAPVKGNDELVMISDFSPNRTQEKGSDWEFEILSDDEFSS